MTCWYKQMYLKNVSKKNIVCDESISVSEYRKRNMHSQNKLKTIMSFIRKASGGGATTIICLNK